MSAQYEVVDKVLIRDYFGPMEVVITKRLAEVKHGKPGWHGCRFDGTGTWGYDDQIMEVRPGPPWDAPVKNRGGIGTPGSPVRIVEYLKDTDNTLWFALATTGILLGAGIIFLRVVFP